ncbi:MAG: type II toxin-antitoxin system RelE/ParE family toxin, partial [Bacteroidota bacterium]
MALRVTWTPRAEKGYDKIIEYLEANWTDKEISNFIAETKEFLKLLEKNPHLLEPSETRKNVFRGPLNRLTILTYRFKPRKKQVELLNIRSA